MKQSFQAGVDTLYNKCVSCGSTPSNKTPTSISNAIQSIYNNRYTEGYNAGKSGKASTIFYLLVHHDGITGDARLSLTEVAYNPDNAGSLATNGILKITDGRDFSINSNNIMTVNRNGTMTIIGQLGANGGTYHYDKMINSKRTRLTNQYGHYYDITELNQGDTVYFVYNNTQAYWYTGSAVIIFQ